MNFDNMSFDTATFLLPLLKIIWINILLSGDNAVVIALACRGLPEKSRKWGIIMGAGVAIVMRIGFTAGFKMNPILYRGAGPALIDVISGTVGLFVDGLPSSIGYLRDGTLKAIAVADSERNRHLPNIPTLAESGLPGMTSYSWFGVSGPKGLAAPIVEKLNTEIRAILQLPAVRQRYNELTADPSDMTPAQYTAYIAEEVRVWGEVVRATGATAE